MIVIKAVLVPSSIGLNVTVTVSPLAALSIEIKVLSMVKFPLSSFSVNVRPLSKLVPLTINFLVAIALMYVLKKDKTAWSVDISGLIAVPDRVTVLGLTPPPLKVIVALLVPSSMG